MKAAILGFGLEGKAILNFLKKSPKYRKAKITVCDKNPKLKIADKFKTVTDLQLGKNYLKNLDRFDIIFRSPGIPYNLAEIQKAIKKGVKFSSATQLFFEEVRKIKCQIIGITGTKGKGTTSTLLYKILKTAGKKVYLAGNIGKPALEILPRLSRLKPQSSFVVLELSSFQLWDLNYSPDIAVVLDVFPDHLDSHKNFEEYLKAKTNIAKWQKKNNKIFYFPDNKYSALIAEKSPAKRIPLKISSFWKNNLKNNLQTPGEHNLKNAAVAANIALSLNCPREKIISAIKKFRGNEHRLELVRTLKIPIKKHSDILKNIRISFYNDSASTNPQTAAAAIRAFKEPKILIAGGKDKNLDYSPLVKTLKDSNTKLVILFGENKNKIAKAISGIKNNKLKIIKVESLKQAVENAYKNAKLLTHNSYPLIYVIFSPASASFDMFRDYKERGKKFKELIKKLK